MDTRALGPSDAPAFVSCQNEYGLLARFDKVEALAQLAEREGSTPSPERARGGTARTPEFRINSLYFLLRLQRHTSDLLRCFSDNGSNFSVMRCQFQASV